MHGVIPLLFIVAVEAARRAFVKASDTRDSQGVPLARWLLSPGRTAALWRRMKLWAPAPTRRPSRSSRSGPSTRRCSSGSTGGAGAGGPRPTSCCP
ncbi:DUF2637 domain-containing protein [Streptomyces sp. SHP22-7]|nr:DUF2637 domain-containing protein [Streptomyces sp. SHP22-7]